MAKITRADPMITGTHRMSAIFDDGDAKFFCDGTDGIHISDMTTHMREQ